MKIDARQDRDYLAYAGNALGASFDPNMSAWIAHLYDDGAIAAVTVFHKVTDTNCEMSIATDGKKGWAQRNYLRYCYKYAFDQLGLRRVSVVIQEDNHASLRLCKKLGHVYEGTLKEWFGDKDGVLMRMTRSECKWIN